MTSSLRARKLRRPDHDGLRFELTERASSRASHRTGIRGPRLFVRARELTPGEPPRSFVDVMKAVLMARGLKPVEKLLLLKIAERGDATGGNAWPSYATLAQAACVDRRRARRIVETLEARGLLTVSIPREKRRGGCKAPNTYSIDLTKIGAPVPPFKDSNEGTDTPIQSVNRGIGAPVVDRDRPTERGHRCPPNGGTGALGSGAQVPPDLPVIFPRSKNSDEEQRAPRAISDLKEADEESPDHWRHILALVHSLLKKHGPGVSDSELSGEAHDECIRLGFSTANHVVARAMSCARFQTTLNRAPHQVTERQRASA